MRVIRGRAWTYGDGVNTDVLFPGRYLQLLQPDEIAAHALEDLDPSFASAVREGDIVVAGRNFGCGSSREQAASALKYAGVGAVVAASFSRIYYRNAINLGLPIVVAPGAVDIVSRGDELEVDLASGTVRNITSGAEVVGEPLPDYVMRILEAGGLIPALRARLHRGG